MTHRRNATTVEKPAGLLTLDAARQVLAFSVPTAANLAGVSTSAMYLACERGEVESTRLCGRILVLSVPFLHRFGLDLDDKAMAAASSSLATKPAHQCQWCPSGRRRRGRPTPG
jgi:hypothetical protein